MEKYIVRQLPYFKFQLRLKQEDIKIVLKRLANDLAYQNPELRQWIDKQKSAFNGLPCDLGDIKFVKEIDGYVGSISAL